MNNLLIIFYSVAFCFLGFVLLVAYKNYRKSQREFKEWQKKTTATSDASEDWHPDNMWF